ncbi:MAG: hypothetical protein QOH31_2920 [Verrucomicrobiota bacterium]
MLCRSEINRAHIIAGLLRNLDSGFGDSFLGTKINFHKVVVAIVGRRTPTSRRNPWTKWPGLNPGTASSDQPAKRQPTSPGQTQLDPARSTR